MALLPTLKLVTVAQDASSITVKDDTGDYSASNPRGFGTPNPPQNTITGIILGLYSIVTPNIAVLYRLAGIVDIFAAGEVLPASRFAGITTGTVYPDSVYGMKYDILYAGAGNITFTGSSKQFTLTNASTVLSSAAGFVLASNLNKIYYIDQTKTLDAAGGWVTEAFPATGATVAFEVAYEGDLKLLIDKAGAKCLTEDIAIWANDGCKDDNFKNIWGRYKQQIAMKSKFTQGYINDANKLAVGLAAYCDCSTPYSPCNC